jgi:hypothetical protein
MPSDKPNKDQIRRAAGKSVPDVITHELCILFCGINPGLYSARSAITLLAQETDFGRCCMPLASPATVRTCSRT